MQENLDELFEQMDKDELDDAEYLTPVQFGKLRGIAPQRIFYLIRVGKLESERCKCGRRVVRVQDVEKALAASSRARSSDLARVDRAIAAGERCYTEREESTVQELSQEAAMERTDN